MYSVSFIFDPGDYDKEFHRLNHLIDEAADNTAGYLGSESWSSRNGTTISAIYYWETLDALETFSRHPRHLEAKRQYSRWYKGYQIVVAQVVRSYGDGGIEHITRDADIDAQ